jgi:hypothetical protein
MNPIKIPNNILDIIEIYYNDVYNRNLNISFPFIDSEIKTIIKEIKKNNNYKNVIQVKYNFMFFITQFILTDDMKNPLDYNKYGGFPKNGFEFCRQTKKFNRTIQYGIFHCHLSELDNSILIWYPILSDDDDQWYMHIEYMKHPSDSEYDLLFNRIYNKSDNGWNIHYNKYFSKLKYLLDTINENKILNFKEFLNKKD